MVFQSTSLKLVLPTSISNLALYLSSIMPIIIFRACSWAHAILSWSGLLNVLLMPASSLMRVENVEVLDRTALVSSQPRPVLSLHALRRGHTGFSSFYPWTCQVASWQHTNRSDELFSFVPTSIKALWLGHSGTLVRWLPVSMYSGWPGPQLMKPWQLWHCIVSPQLWLGLLHLDRIPHTQMMTSFNICSMASSIYSILAFICHYSLHPTICFHPIASDWVIYSWVASLAHFHNISQCLCMYWPWQFPGSYHCGKKVWNAMEVLRVSALYYSTGNAGGVWTLASAHVLCLTTTTHVRVFQVHSGSFETIWKFQEFSGSSEVNPELSIDVKNKLEYFWNWQDYFWNFRNWGSGVQRFRVMWVDNENENQVDIWTCE